MTGMNELSKLADYVADNHAVAQLLFPRAEEKIIDHIQVKEQIEIEGDNHMIMSYLSTYIDELAQGSEGMLLQNLLYQFEI